MAHQKNKFVWFELNSKDVERSKRFYSEVAGWKIQEVDMGQPYTMLNVGENSVGGIVPTDGDAHWISYLSVDDVDEAIGAVKKNGGKQIKAPIDFPNVGRFGRVADPQGGELFLFRSAQGDPDDRDQVQGDFHWNELWAEDAKTAADFYVKTLGFGHDTMDMPNGAYHLLKRGEKMSGGLMDKPEGVPVMWLPYIKVDDADAAVKRATQNGGKLMGEMMDVPNVGRFGIVLDPDGAAIGLIKPAA